MLRAIDAIGARVVPALHSVGSEAGHPTRHTGALN
jgi:hypothetical protein